MAEKHGPPPKLIELEVDPPRKTPTGYETIATAIVSLKTRERRTLFGEPVMFFVNSVQVGGVFSTDPNGRISTPITLPADTRFASVDAQLVGTGLQARKVVEVKETKPKRPGEEELEIAKINLERAKVAKEIIDLAKPPTKVARKVYVTFRGEHGQQKIFISVSDGEGMKISNFPVLIVDGDDPKSESTNALGDLIYPMNFTERSRYVEVRAGNEHNLIWRGRLLGPAERGLP